MREILFRGKSVGDGKWIEGGLFVQQEDDVKDFAAYILKPSLAHFCNASLVDSATVGQYTGLTDKNGKKIFEGDIVDILTENEEIGIVYYEDGGFLVEADGFCVDFHSNINGTDVEVIGNIHDNPDLLKGDNDAAR